MDLIDLYKTLPDEIIHKIMDYTDAVIYRNGIYMNRLLKNDTRYTLLSNITKPRYIGRYKILLRLVNKRTHNSGHIIEYEVRPDVISFKISFFYKESTGYDKYYEITPAETYIFDINNKWSKTVQYIM
jgi:hypothetical protein